MPDTTAYLLLGLGATLVIMGGFVVSVLVRYRNLRNDLRLIEELKKND